MKKIIVDILLFILMLLEFQRTYLPPEIHEIIGICLIILVIIHLLLNRKYIKAIPKGKYNAKISLTLIINVGFFITFTLTVMFGILSSQDILTFFNIKNMTTIYLHKIFGNLSLILLGMHLGTNLKLKYKKSLNVVYIPIILFGIYSIVRLDLSNHLIGNYGFSIMTANILINSIEYLSIILMITILTNCLKYKISNK